MSNWDKIIKNKFPKRWIYNFSVAKCLHCGQEVDQWHKHKRLKCLVARITDYLNNK